MSNDFLPENGLIDHIAMDDGIRLRTGFFPAKGKATATILLVSGHREFLEKYTEFIEDFQKRGFDVYGYDHRGQGGSDRMLKNPIKSHNPDFGRIVVDMHQIVEKVIKPARPDHPLYLIAHSMGTQFAIRYLHDHPGIFEKAVLLSPFSNFNIGGKLFTFLTKASALLANFLGFSKFFAPGQAHDRNMIDHRDAFEALTHDHARYDWSQKALESKPHLFIGGVTFGWLKGVMKSMKIIQSAGYVEDIKTPILALLAEEENVVDNDMTLRLLDKMPNASYEIIKGARHETYREIDEIRDQVIAKIEEFFAS